jgi:hypothetical protein
VHGTELRSERTVTVTDKVQEKRRFVVHSEINLGQRGGDHPVGVVRKLLVAAQIALINGGNFIEPGVGNVGNDGSVV